MFLLLVRDRLVRGLRVWRLLVLVLDLLLRHERNAHTSTLGHQLGSIREKNLGIG